MSGFESPASHDGDAAGLLYPRQNRHHSVQDLAGLWQFQIDPNSEGEAAAWFDGLPAPRSIPVPCSWNDLFDDARDYLGLAWYLTETWTPSAWHGERILLRVGSANYAARVWVNGALVATHQGGRLPFVADITDYVTTDGPTTIAIAVENEQLPERVPPGPGTGRSGIAAFMRNYPQTTYDFFPYAGLQRPVLLSTVPVATHIDDVTVRTAIEGEDGVVELAVVATGGYSGTGTVSLGGATSPLAFVDGRAETTLRVPWARFWGPADPHLYPLTVALTDGGHEIDAYTLDIGIRTVEVSGDRILLNGQPIHLNGFGKHEDFPLSGRGLNLPALVRDHELMAWVGANSYRTAHYPYSEEAMQLADRLGMLVINEIPAVGLDFADAPDLVAARQDQCLRQLRELVARDKNHPSTIMWSVANEPFGGGFPGFAPRRIRRRYRRRPPRQSQEMWSEEYQVEFLRGFLDVAAARPFVAGLHVWNFADFKTGQGIMRASGLNQKGVFTRDRRPKMAAHFLRSRWRQA
jgi:beta-glucuronidase